MSENSPLILDLEKLAFVGRRILNEIENWQTTLDATEKDWYWVLLAPERYDFGNGPGKPAVGDLRDDWEILMSILDEDEPVAMPLIDNFAAVLRVISDIHAGD